MTNDILTQEQLKEYLHYNPETGIFIRKNNKLSKCGTISEKNYLLIIVNKKPYMAHRLAWLYIYGDWPINQIDHINGHRLDNRIENLRDVSQNINQQNQKLAHKNNTTGYLGVTKLNSKFLAQIRINGKKRYLGLFATAFLAHQAYLNTKRQLHEGCMI